MPIMPPQFRSAGQRTKVERQRSHDQRRGSARDRGYSSKWDAAAKAFLEHHPLCLYCRMGAWGDPPRATPATLVDHLIPHRGDMVIFWNRRDWVSSCAPCHNGPKASAERNGRALTVLANAVRAFVAKLSPRLSPPAQNDG